MTYRKHYAKNGNTLFTLNYTLGEKDTYSFVDGQRTFKTTKIKRTSAIVVTVKPSKKSPTKPLDDRYSVRIGYEYDDKNRGVEETRFRNDGKAFKKSVYKYNEKGQIVEIEKYHLYDSEKPITTESRKYDDNNNVIEKRIVLMGHKDKMSKTLYSNYKFDSHGNWIDRLITTVYENNRLSKEFDHRKISTANNKLPQGREPSRYSKETSFLFDENLRFSNFPIPHDAEHWGNF